MEHTSASGPQPNCNRCSGFFITHDPAFPYGCRHMGFRSRWLPSQEVQAASGRPCLRFEPKVLPRG